MQRILLLSSVHPATDPRILYKIAPALARHYTVMCTLPNGKKEDNTVAIVPLPYYRKLLARIFLCHPLILWKCMRFRPDLVHIFVPELIPVAILFQWMGAKIIYEVQENLFKKFEIKQYNNAALFRYLFRYFDAYARKNFHCILTEEAYLQEYNDLKYKPVVINNYVSLSFIDAHTRLKTPLASPQPAIFYSGVISMERCFETLVEAVGLLSLRYPTLLVHMFGPVRLTEEQMSQILNTDRLKKHFKFYGYTDLQISLGYAQDCIAGIALLKPVADYPDSYPGKLFEYMALNLPVITSNFTLYRNIVEKSQCGFCIDPSNAGLLANTIDWIITHRPKATLMGNNGRKAAERNYNWNSEEKKLLNLYQDIL